MARRLLAMSVGAILAVAMSAGSVLAQPGNDSALTPTVITSLPFADSLDTTTATSDPGDPSAFCGPLTNTVWYTFNAGPAGNSHVILNTGSSTYSAVMYITTGAPSGPFVGCGGVNIDLVAAPSTTYYIMVGDCCGAGGMLEFSATQGLAFGGSVNPVASFNAKSGIVTVSGTYLCNMPATVDAINVDLKQAVGRFIISGGGGLGPNSSCAPGTTYTWTVQVGGSNGKFAGGKATAQLEVGGHDASGSSWFSFLGSFPVKIAK